MEARGVRTAPMRKIRLNPISVHLLPNLADIGADPNAPKNAPAWSTDTTLDETAVTLPGVESPKWDWK